MIRDSKQIALNIGLNIQAIDLFCGAGGLSHGNRGQCAFYFIFIKTN